MSHIAPVSPTVHLVEATVVGGCPTILKSATIDFINSSVTKYMIGKFCDRVNCGKPQSTNIFYYRRGKRHFTRFHYAD
jgi:hypothetical protein